jgi:hypothetical protein
MAEALLMRGAHAGYDALLHALRWCTSSRVLQLLLQRGISDKVGGSIFIAAQASLQELVEMLLNSDKPGSEAMATRLEAAVCGAAMHANLQLLQFLLEPPTKFLPGRADAVGRRIMQQVLYRGLNAATQGRTYKWGPGPHDPLIQHHLSSGIAALEQRAEVVTFLLKLGADQNYEGGKPLYMAVHGQQGPMLHELLRAGANQIDPALELAAGRGQTDTVSLLLSVTEGPVDPSGTALELAASAGHRDIVRMLRERGTDGGAALVDYWR